MMKKVITIIFLASLFACAEKQPVKKELKEIAREVMIASKNCALITVDSFGVAQARAMDPFLPEEDFTIWMATNPKSKKVSDIANNPKVTLYYFDKNDPGYVTLQGTATLVNDTEKKEKFWKKEWKNFYKNRDTDYLLIKVIPEKLYVISEHYKVLGDTITWKAPEIKLK
jgi:general stress protein 26